MQSAEAREWFAREEQERAELYFALRSRILTDEEMGRVADMGLRLVTQNFVPYTESDKHAELNAALLQQFKMRAYTESLVK